MLRLWPTPTKRQPWLQLLFNSALGCQLVMMCSTGRLKVIRYFAEDTIIASVFIWCCRQNWQRKGCRKISCIMTGLEAEIIAETSCNQWFWSPLVPQLQTRVMTLRESRTIRVTYNQGCTGSCLKPRTALCNYILSTWSFCFAVLNYIHRVSYNDIVILLAPSSFLQIAPLWMNIGKPFSQRLPAQAKRY
jgi:hypothetical protein